MFVSINIILLEIENRFFLICICMEILCIVKWLGFMDYVDLVFCIDSFVENN